MAEGDPGQFDNELHEQAVARRYEALARYAAFDRLIDMALDSNGQISVDDAIKVYVAEELPSA